MACSSKVGKITYFHQKKVKFFMKNHKILILRSKFHKFYFWSDFNECGMFQRFQNYIQNCSMMNIAESPCLKSIFAIWGSGEYWTQYWTQYWTHIEPDIEPNIEPQYWSQYWTPILNPDIEPNIEPNIEPDI